jgi:ParB/RepB/Spo0J family partition protein
MPIYKKTDKEQYIHPIEITPDYRFNGRRYEIDKSKIIELANSMLPPPLGSGQLQSVLVRPINGVLALVFGYTRHKAALWLHSEGGHPEFRLRCVVRIMDDAAAFKANVIENRHRIDPNVIDDAINAKRMREEFHFSEQDIAVALRCSRSWLSCLKKLANLPSDLQDRVASGSIPIVSAINMASLDNDSRDKMVSSGNVSVDQVRGAIRDQRDGVGAPLARSVSEIKRYLHDKTKEYEKQNEIKDFFEKLLLYCEGGINDFDMNKVCKNLRRNLK